MPPRSRPIRPASPTRPMPFRCSAAGAASSSASRATGQVVPAIQPLIANPPVDSALVVTAGELQQDRAGAEAVRTGEERLCHRLLCRRRQGRSTASSTRRPAAPASSIAPDARAALKQLIGSDRMASRGEVAKLCLYAEGSRRDHPRRRPRRGRRCVGLCRRRGGGCGRGRRCRRPSSASIAG